MGTSIVIKEGKHLTPDEVKSIDVSRNREWNLPPVTEDDKNKHTFIFIKNNLGEILSEAQLFPLPFVIFNNEHFDLLEIGGVISNIKGQGYGRKLMEAVKTYLQENKKTGIGFTSMQNSIFYGKCGFQIDFSSLNRFINYQQLTGEDEDCVFYIDGEDRFMERVLANRLENIYLTASEKNGGHAVKKKE